VPEDVLVVVNRILDELDLGISRIEKVHANADRFTSVVIDRVLGDLNRQQDTLRDRAGEAFDQLEVEVAISVGRREELESGSATARVALEEIELRALIEIIDAETGDALAAEHRGSVEAADTEIAQIEQRLGQLRTCIARRPSHDEPDDIDADFEVIEMDEGELEEADFELDIGHRLAVLVYSEGSEEEQVHPVGGEALTIGRGRDNDVQVRNDKKVSRYHCVVENTGSNYELRDLDSANGTLVNGALVEDDRRLFGGEELIIGETFFRFRLMD